MRPDSPDNSTLRGGSWYEADPAAAPDRTGDGEALRLLERLAIDDRGVETWLALQEDLQRQVVVRLRPDAAEYDPELLHEALICAWLDHPGVMTIHDADQRRVVQRCVMLRSLAENWAGISTLADLCEVLIRACQTLAHVHARGVVHGAFEASCLAVGAFGEVLITGWNQARIAGWAVDLAKRQQRPPPPMVHDEADVSCDLRALGRLLATLPVSDATAPSAGLLQDLIATLEGAGAGSDITVVGVISALSAVQGQVAAEQRAQGLLETATHRLPAAQGSVGGGRLAQAQEGLQAVDAALALRPDWSAAVTLRRALLAETIMAALALDDLNLAAGLAADPDAGLPECTAVAAAQRALVRRQRLGRALRILSWAALLVIAASVALVQVVRRHELVEAGRRRQQGAERLMAQALVIKDPVTDSDVRRALVWAVQAVGLDDHPDHRAAVVALAERSIAIHVEQEALDTAWHHLELARRFGLGPEQAEALIGDPQQEGTIRHAEDAPQRRRREARARRQDLIDHIMDLSGRRLRPTLVARIATMIAGWDRQDDDPEMAALTAAGLRRLLDTEGSLQEAVLDGLAQLTMRHRQRGLPPPMTTSELKALWPDTSSYGRNRILACLLPDDDGSVLPWLADRLAEHIHPARSSGPGRAAFRSWLRRAGPGEEQAVTHLAGAQRDQRLRRLATLYRIANDDAGLGRVTALGYEGSEIDGYIQRFRRAYFNGDIAAARAAVRDLDAIEGVDARDLLPSLAELILRRGDKMEAAAIIDEALARPAPSAANRLPPDVAVTRSLPVQAVIIYTQVKRMADAKALVDDVVRYYSVERDGRSAGDLVTALYTLGMDATALRILAVTLSGLDRSDDMWAYYYLARSLYQHGALAAALSVCNRAIARWPQFHYAYARRARLHALLGHQEAAEADAQMALSIMPRRPGILGGHAEVLMLRGDYDQALSRFLKGRQLMPNYRGEQLSVMNAARQAGHHGSALEVARSRPDEDLRNRLWLLRCLLEAGAGDLAVEHLVAWLADTDAAVPLDRQVARMLLDMLLVQVPQLRATGWRGMAVADHVPWLWWEACATAMTVPLDDETRHQRALALLAKAEALGYRPEVTQAIVALIKAAVAGQPSSRLATLAQAIIAEPLSYGAHPAETLLRHHVISKWVEEFQVPSGRPPWPIPMPTHNFFVPLACDDLALSPAGQQRLVDLLATQRALYGLDPEEPEHDDEAHRLLAAQPQPAPQRHLSDLATAIRTLSRGQPDWDFPPQSYRERQQQRRAQREAEAAQREAEEAAQPDADR